MTTKSLSLLDEAAACMGCQYLSDLHYLTPYQRCVLATQLECFDAGQYSLFEWNDALEYLVQEKAEASAASARTKLLNALRRMRY